jgi:hypothetical protein
MRKFLNALFFIAIYTLAITLIEYNGEWLLDMAGDVFGSLAIMFLGLYVFGVDLNN